MRLARTALAAAAIGVALAGCTISGNLGGGATAGPPPIDEALLRPVGRVDELLVGRTFDGVVLTAFGEAPGAGWTAGRLRPRGPGPDGFLEFDFVALPPPADSPPAADDPRLRRIRADLPLALDELGGAAGLRVIAAGGARAVGF
jgi:hypothetical protein